MRYTRGEQPQTLVTNRPTRLRTTVRRTIPPFDIRLGCRYQSIKQIMKKTGHVLLVVMLRSILSYIRTSYRSICKTNVFATQLPPALERHSHQQAFHHGPDTNSPHRRRPRRLRTWRLPPRRYGRSLNHPEARPFRGVHPRTPPIHKTSPGCFASGSTPQSRRT